ncbi:hypothetical protein SKAU_G00197100 [Synaphobranchus kaupii]|uniref:Integrase catalytic domain-containing protein n=1 Tax=Synaphobranchus kaupii TaxID=118154 RepID=A0A9Q1FEU4_SYNKA|nr:hypothetical protein SKAU_G00197100 [Synaphobranchus kaupii]
METLTASHSAPGSERRQKKRKREEHQLVAPVCAAVMADELQPAQIQEVQLEDPEVDPVLQWVQEGWRPTTYSLSAVYQHQSAGEAVGRSVSESWPALQKAETTQDWRGLCTAGEELHSDQGCNFESQAFAVVCHLLTIRKTLTTPLHPQSDGLVERFN